MLKIAVPAAAAALFCSVPLRADVIVSSFPQWNGLTSLTPTGTSFQALGQTFTVPDGVTTLDAIRTRVDLSSSTTGIRIYVFATAGNQATGAPLFRSDPVVESAPPGSNFTLLEYTGLGAAVTPGQTYVLLFSNAEGPSSGMHGSYFAATLDAPVAPPLLGNIVGFGFEFPAPGQGLVSLTGTPWTVSPTSRDLIVELTFVPTPGPAGALALGVLGLSRRRRVG